MSIYMLQSGGNSSSSSGLSGGAIAGVVIAMGVVLLVLAYICSRNTHDVDNDAADPAERAAAAAFAALPRAPPTAPAAPYWDEEEYEAARRRRARSQRGSRTSGLPSFTYNLSVKHNVTTGSGAGEDAAATCSVCLGAFQVGETVRLLPVCLHLYHVDCIDPWLEVHSTCPICRSGTDLTMDGSLLPPV